MCGISAIITSSGQVFDFLFRSLENLQNRGYDSAGVCGIDNDGAFVLHKRASTDEQTALEKLKEEGMSKFDFCSIGIAHTRWATHGEKNDANSHPHVCYRGKIALVHNGIIENFAELKKDLINKGITFKSETDTEVIVNLISYYNTSMSLLKAIKKACSIMEGTWALAIISNESNMLYFTRHGAPLLIAKTETDIIITSETAGLYTLCKDVKSYAVVQESKVYQMSASSTIDCETKDIHHDDSICYSPYPFKHWTLKEIDEQKVSIQRALNNGGRFMNETSVKLGGLQSNKANLMNCKHVVIIGCGTSFNSGLVGAQYFNKLRLFKSVRAVNAAEFDMDTIQYDHEETVVIFLSQSGETRDLINCLDICKKLNIVTLGVVNVVDSYIARETDCGVYLNAGREVGVASTKSFTSQVIVLTLISVWFHQYIYPLDTDVRHEIISDLKGLANDTQNFLTNINTFDFKGLVSSLEGGSMFVLGTKGKDTAVALEGALKIKEISYVHCEGLNTASLKHGPLALIQKGTPVLYVISNDMDAANVFNSVEEVKSRKGMPIIIGNHSKADIQVITKNQFGFLWNNIVIQLIAYNLSVSKGINPDMPRNLAKVVTVG
jgi:glucosamine--fructose-6-phosphate aminotransferase (isomerizing)